MNPSTTELKNIIARYDVNKDGRLGFDEFKVIVEDKIK